MTNNLGAKPCFEVQAGPRLELAMLVLERGAPLCKTLQMRSPGDTSRTLEQGQVDRREASSPAEARMVDTQQVANRGARTRPGHV